MPKKDYTTIPAQFAVCLHGDCPMATTCLHQVAYEEMVMKNEYLYFINPTRCVKDQTCKHYRSSQPEIFARGFTNFQKKMYPGQYETFKHLLIGYFSRNCFYERRRGDYAISPKEQQIILKALFQAGVTEELKFDSYEERINWYD